MHNILAFWKHYTVCQTEPLKKLGVTHMSSCLSARRPKQIAPILSGRYKACRLHEASQFSLICMLLRIRKRKPLLIPLNIATRHTRLSLFYASIHYALCLSACQKRPGPMRLLATLQSTIARRRFDAYLHRHSLARCSYFVV